MMEYEEEQRASWTTPPNEEDSYGKRPKRSEVCRNGYNFENCLNFSHFMPINGNLGQIYAQNNTYDRETSPIMDNSSQESSYFTANEYEYESLSITTPKHSLAQESNVHNILPIYNLAEKLYDPIVTHITSNNYEKRRSDSELVSIIMNEENPDESSSIPPFHQIIPNREFPYLLGDKNSSCSSPTLSRAKAAIQRTKWKN